MLIMLRQGPFEAKQVPQYGDFEIIRYVQECTALATWCDGESHMMHDEGTGQNHILVPTTGNPEGDQALPGEWIVQWDKGKFMVMNEVKFDFSFQPLKEHEYVLGGTKMKDPYAKPQ